MNINKALGFILLTVGLLLIVVPLWQTYSIFTGKSLPAQIFMQSIPLKVDQNIGPNDIQGQIQNAVVRVIPTESINNTLNLASWLILMWVLIYGGGKIAEIGVKLLNGNK